MPVCFMLKANERDATDKLTEKDQRKQWLWKNMLTDGAAII